MQPIKSTFKIPDINTFLFTQICKFYTQSASCVKKKRLSLFNYFFSAKIIIIENTKNINF